LVVPLVAAAETIRAALNASYSFVLPAAMNLFMNGLTASIILLYHGPDIRVVAAAYVAGAVFQLLVITGLAWRHGLRVRLSWRVDDPRVIGALQLSGRPTVSSLLNLGNRVVEQLVASFLPSGSITVLSYGQRLISALGGGIFFRPVTVALLPRLADAEHADDRPAVSALVSQALKFVLAIALPLTAFTVALADPVVRLVFHRGSFGPVATHLLALTLAIYGASLVGSGVQRVLLAPFYARLDTRTPLRNTFYGVVVDLVLLLPCIALFGRHSINAVLGVAVAYSITQYFIVAHAWVRLRATVRLRGAEVLAFAGRAGLGCALATWVMLWLVSALGIAGQTQRGRLLLATIGIGLAGAAVMTLVAGLVFGPGATRRALSRRKTRRDQDRGPALPALPADEPLGRTGDGSSALWRPVEPAGSVPNTPGEDPAVPGAAHPWGAEREARALVHQTVTESAIEATEPARGRRPVGLVLLLVGFPASLLVAVATGVLAVRGVGRTELIVPLAALLGLGFVVLGLVRFEWFVLCALAIRTLVDFTKVGAGSDQLGTGNGDAVSSGPAASALAILFIAMSLVWLLARRRSADRRDGAPALRFTVADAAFAFFVGSCLLSVIGSVNRAATLTETARIVAAVLMFVVLERLLTSMARVRRVLVACFVALAAPVGLGVYQAVTGHGRFETAGVSRVVGTFLHPNTFGFFLSMFMLMAIALYRHCEPRTRLALALVTGLCGALLVLTYSRGSWIAFTLGLVLIGLLQSRLVFAWILGGALLA
ncbi:MAG: lipid II flippase MurJ, partial [Actinomycetes bacterium]